MTIRDIISTLNADGRLAMATVVQIESLSARHGDTRSGLLAHAALEYVAARDDR